MVPFYMGVLEAKTMCILHDLVMINGSFYHVNHMEEVQLAGEFAWERTM